MNINTEKIDLANNVLREIKKIVSSIEPALSTYHNGRESGYCLTAADRKVCFSENRNTDEIVIYCGRLEDFNFQGNLPSEITWADRKFFPQDQTKKAAEYIAAYLTTGE